MNILKSTGFTLVNREVLRHYVWIIYHNEAIIFLKGFIKKNTVLRRKINKTRANPGYLWVIHTQPLILLEEITNGGARLAEPEASTAGRRRGAQVRVAVRDSPRREGIHSARFRATDPISAWLKP